VVCERATLFGALLSLLYPPVGTITDLPSGNHTWLENLQLMFNGGFNGKNMDQLSLG